jgi:hypothetical protein
LPLILMLIVITAPYQVMNFRQVQSTHICVLYDCITFPLFPVLKLPVKLINILKLVVHQSILYWVFYRIVYFKSASVGSSDTGYFLASIRLQLIKIFRIYL